MADRRVVGRTVVSKIAFKNPFLYIIGILAAAQISLVQLTGQNFGNDSTAWGDWYNANRAELGTDLPPFDPMPVDWAFGLNEGQLQFHADPANQDRLDAQWFQRQNY